MSRGWAAQSDPPAQRLQLGVGQSVIVDLPEEAGEIYVGDPNVANAIVRSAKRVYISGVANGQTSIFALARDGRKIAAIQVSVGRAVGELSNLLNAAIPGNEIRVRTVENTIILTGSVASAEEAQKALDIADGFVNNSARLQLGTALRSPSRTARSAGGVSGGAGGKSSDSPRGRVINALTIRGADQVSLRVTVAEIRRDIVKQLGVNLSGSGPNGSFTLDNPFAINGAVAASEGTLNWFKGSQSLSATLQAFERQGVAHTLAEPTVTAVSGETAKFLAGGTIPILNSVQCNPVCQYGFIQQPYGVTLNFTPVVLSQGRIQLRIATEVTDIDYAKQITFSGISIPGFRTRNNTTTVELPSGGSIASAGLISTQIGAGDQWLSGADESPSARRLVSFAGLSAQRDGAFDRCDAIHCARGRPEPGREARPEFPGRQRSADLVPGPRQPDLLHLAVAPADAWLRGQDRIHHPVGLACFAKHFLRSEKEQLSWPLFPTHDPYPRRKA